MTAGDREGLGCVCVGAGGEEGAGGGGQILASCFIEGHTEAQGEESSWSCAVSSRFSGVCHCTEHTPFPCCCF